MNNYEENISKYLFYSWHNQYGEKGSYVDEVTISRDSNNVMKCFIYR